MKDYTVTIEVALKDVTEARADELVDELQDYGPAVSSSARGWLSATITLPAASLAQATSSAVAVVQTAAGAEAIGALAMTTAERDAREGWDSEADLLSTTEAARLLGVSRQAVLERIERKTLPAEKIGKRWTIPRAALRLDLPSNPVPASRTFRAEARAPQTSRRAE